MPQRNARVRSAWLGLATAGACLLAGTGFRTSTSGTGAATPAVTRTILYGWRGNRASDNWNECNDSSGAFAKPVPVVLRTQFDGAHALAIQPMSGAEVRAVYAAAFDACFLMDYDEGGLPGGPRRKEWLHDVVTVRDGASETALHLRPSSKVPKMLTDSLKPNEAFIAGDLFNPSTTRSFVNSGAHGDMALRAGAQARVRAPVRPARCRHAGRRRRSDMGELRSR